MKVPEAVIWEAFALARARGAELLTRLGDFDVWRGNLSEMRGDSPRSAPGGTAQDHSAERNAELKDGSADDPLTTPDWITEREHAASAGDRRRR